jgi:hypothetical protein
VDASLEHVHARTEAMAFETEHEDHGAPGIGIRAWTLQRTAAGPARLNEP